MMTLVCRQQYFDYFSEHLRYEQILGAEVVFFDIYESLCKRKGVSTSKVAETIGLNRTAVTKWRKGAIPEGNTLRKIADYFGVSVDYLLGKEENKPDRKSGFSDDDLRFALFGGDADEITDAQLEEVKRFARFVLERDKDRK